LLFYVLNGKMFVGLTSLLLILFIEQRDFSQTATVVLYRTGTNDAVGTLNIYQSDSNSSVVINGSIKQLNNNTRHVYSKSKFCFIS